MCRILGISESGYHAWRKRPPSRRAQANARLEVEIKAAYERTRQTYGPERLQADLADNGILVGIHRIKRIRSKLGVKTASNEHELANISSNGLSYIILCVILIGFVNRIRRSENVVVPFVVDELKDLSFANAKTLLDLLTRNNITMISAFPDVDLDLSELFERNYKILPGRKVDHRRFQVTACHCLCRGLAVLP
jgi:hypothetical protein